MFLPTFTIVAAAMWIHLVAPFEVNSKLSDLVSPHGHNGSGGGSGSQLRQWSSIIGIVTAIVGNILISFALNTQRYDHIRIEREHNETHQLTTKSGKGVSRRRRNYGTTTQEDIAEERARLNANVPGPGERQETQKITQAPPHDSDDEVDENHPLKASFQSDETLTSEKDRDDGSDGRKTYLKSGYWWIGIIMMTIGEAGNFLAYGFAPASVVSPLGVVALISNCLIAPLLLKERFRQRDFWGVVVAIAGAVTIVASAKHNETKMGPNDVWQAIKRWEFVLYLGITCIAIIALMIASPKYGGRTILIDLGLVGLFGGYTAISTKGVASLLSDTLWRTFTFPISYLLVAILVVSAIMQIRYINRALRRFDSTQVIPTQFVLFTISVIIGSAVLYREFESTTATRVGEFTGGCLLTFFGVYLITSGRARNETGPEDDDFSATDQHITLVDEEAESSVRKPNGIGKGHHGKRTGTTTPDSTVSDRYSDQLDGLPYKPSTASTTESIPPATLVDFPEGDNPWRSVADQVLDTDGTPSPYTRSSSDIPQTPQLNRTQSGDGTPYYTPATTGPSRPAQSLAFLRIPSSPADPETPTRPSRTASPPKADPALRQPTTPTRSARSSIARLTPAPLITPLSSSLSAVVADSLRRGEGTSRSNRERLRRGRNSQARRSSLFDDEDLLRHPTNEIEPESDNADVVGGDGSVRHKKSRLRSMSDAIGGLIAGKGKRRKRDDEDGRRGASEGSAV
jgi:drug/metabolite transporter (DMT)-like permease